MTEIIDEDVELDENLEDNVELEAIASRERFEANIKNMWGHSAVGLEAKKAAMTMLSTKTGMYAKIPIVCKADSCPYAQNCQLLKYGLAPLGEYCPVETAEIEMRFQGYSDDFGLDGDVSFTDKCIVSEIINCDIMMERCKALMAAEGVPVIDVVAGISENGETFTHPEVSKHWDAYERINKKRNEAYQLMLATRKDRKGEDEGGNGFTDFIKDITQDANFAEIEERPDKLKE